MRLKKSYFLMISILGLVAIFSSTMSKSPILPLFAMSLITSPHEVQFIGYVIAASTIPGIIVSAFAGRLSDMYGREKLVLLSVVIFASAPFFYLFATNIWILMIVRFYHGFSTAIFVPVATSAIAELYPKQKGEKISLFSSITLVGRFFAPITGGFIPQIIIIMECISYVVSQELLRFSLQCFITKLANLVILKLTFQEESYLQ
jgi:MFS family permease